MTDSPDLKPDRLDGLVRTAAGIIAEEFNSWGASSWKQYEGVARSIINALAARDRAAAAEPVDVTWYRQQLSDARSEIARQYQRADAAEAAIAARDRAAKRYMLAVRRLGENSGYNNLSFFEAPISKMPNDELGMEAVDRWRELNDAGVALSSAVSINSAETGERS